MTDHARYILSKLFSLRAGLSAASLEKEALAKAETAYLNDDKNYQENLKALRDAEKELSDTEREIAEERAVLTKRSKRRNILTIFFLISAIAGALFYTEEKYRLLGIGLLALSVIIPVIVSFIIAPKLKSYRKPNRALIRDLEKEGSRLRKSIKQLNAKVKELYPEHSKTEAVFENEKVLRTLNAKDIFNSLTDQHSSILPQEYWQYADIMFYYFETQKCENIEYCIALLDRLKESEFLESSSVKATRNLNLRCSKLLSEAKVYLSHEFAILALKIERRSSHFHNLIASGKLFNDMKTLLSVNSQTLYEDMMQLVNLT